MASDALLRIKVITDATQAALGLDAVGKKASGFQGAMQKAALPAAAVGVALVALGKKALDSAATLQQAQGAVDAVFGAQGKTVEAYAKGAADDMGLAASAYMNYASLVGGALKNAGFSQAEAADKSHSLMQRAADMAATYGGTTSDAVEAINAAISRSEFDPLEKFNVSLNATAVNAELAKRGQDKLTGSALQHAKAQIIMEQIYKKSADTAGQYAREQESAGGSAQTAAAHFENASAALGKALLPAATATAKALAKMAQFVTKNATLVGVMAAALGALVTAILIYNAAMKIAAIVQTAFNVALSANVIFLVIVGVIALVAAFVLLYKKVEWFRKAVDFVWRIIKKGAAALVRYVKGEWSGMTKTLVATFAKAAGFVSRAWDRIKRVAATVVGAIARIWDRVKQKTIGVWDSIKQKIANVVEWMKGKIAGFKDRAAAVFEGVRDKVRNVFDSVKGIAQNAVDRVRDFLGKITDTLRNLVPDSLKNSLTAPFEAAKGVINAVKSAIDAVIRAIGTLIGKIGNIRWPSVPSSFKKVMDKVGFSVAPPAPARTVAPAPGVTARSGVPGVAAGAGAVQINVYGALDPEGVARQVGRILYDHSRRMGQTPA